MSEKFGSFSEEELTATYPEFEKIKKERKKDLHVDALKWLHEWEMHDLFNSPIDDNKRRYIRLGHFIGYFAK